MNATVLCAGATVFLWYAFGALPLQLSVADQLGLDPARASSWISIVWMSSAVASIAISLPYRQPIPALAVAATPFTVLGVGSAFWALLCGLAASAAAERTQLTAFWKAA